MKKPKILTTGTTTKLPSLKPFVDWYLKPNIPNGASMISHRDLLAKCMKDFSTKVLSGTLSQHQIADMYFDNPHFWALKSYFKHTVYPPLYKDFVSAKPWTHVPGSFSDFEALYTTVSKSLKRKYVSRLYLYDLSLWLSVLDTTGSLLPNNHVYVHATPMTAYQAFYKKGYFAYKPKGSNCVIPKSVFLPSLSPLTAYEIEDLLCHIGKCVRKNILGKNKPTALCIPTTKTASSLASNPYDELMKLTRDILF